jgi:hypothetical protein
VVDYCERGEDDEMEDDRNRKLEQKRLWSDEVEADEAWILGEDLKTNSSAPVSGWYPT